MKEKERQHRRIEFEASVSGLPGVASPDPPPLARPLSASAGQASQRRAAKVSRSAATPLPPQVKVCGLTVIEEAVGCAEMGADAIGLVFYPPSPRWVSMLSAREISLALPHKVWKVGVFVDEPLREVLKKVEFCRLN